jgi:hypothetical protein
VRQGLELSPGFIRFLESQADADLYAGVSPGDRIESDFQAGPYDLIRLPVRVNGKPVSAVLDTGASYCILTRSFATEVGLAEIPGSDAFGRGLHQKPIPLTFGVIGELELGASALTSVPAMIMPDDALSFETERGELHLPMVLGLHLLKEFAVGIEYDRQRISLTRLVAGGPKPGRDQNLFYARGKVMVRVSIDDEPWTLFLLDSGSELTMLTSGGLRRQRLRPSAGAFPKRVEGIGKSRVSWGKVDEVSMGVAGWRFHFRDMVVAETDETLEDGVLGASALRHFRVRIDFGSMKLELEEPIPVSDRP